MLMLTIYVSSIVIYILIHCTSVRITYYMTILYLMVNNRYVVYVAILK